MTDSEYAGPFNEMPLDHIRRFLRAYDSGVFDNVPTLGQRYSYVIVAGMGGSGVVGSAIVDLAKNVAKVPIDVLRANRLPAFTTHDTLALIISYSGNTREMLELYDECVSRGCRIIVITTGGKLGERAKADGKQVIMLDGGFTPRSDIGFAIGYAASVIDMNCGTHIMDMFVSGLRSAEPYAEKLSRSDDPDNLHRSGPPTIRMLMSGWISSGVCTASIPHRPFPATYPCAPTSRPCGPPPCPPVST